MMTFQQYLEMPQISLSNKKVLADDKPLKELNVDALTDNIVLFRQPESDRRSIILPGTTWLYFMDSEQSAQEITDGQIPMLMVPQGTFFTGGSPITDVWKKKFYRKGTDQPRERMENGKRVMVDGTNKILGIIEGHSDKKIIFVNMMTVRPPYKRNSINSKMIQYLIGHFPEAELRFSKATEQGKKFINAFKKDS